MDKANHITRDQAENDLETLIRAAGIRRDRKRMANARAVAQERLAAYVQVSIDSDNDAASS